VKRWGFDEHIPRMLESFLLCVLAALREILIVVINDLILPEGQIVLPIARIVL